MFWGAGGRLMRWGEWEMCLCLAAMQKDASPDGAYRRGNYCRLSQLTILSIAAPYRVY